MTIVEASTQSDLAETLQHEGYFVLRKLLDAKSVERVKERLRYLIRNRRFFRQFGIGMQDADDEAIASGKDPLRHCQKVGNAPHLDPIVAAETTFHPGMIELLTRIIGQDIALNAAGFFCKPPHTGVLVPWHQDSGLWGPEGGWDQNNIPLIFDCFLAIDPCIRRNSGLMIIPGSHERGVMPHVNTGKYFPEVDIASQGYTEADILPIDLEPGDLLVYHQDTLHHSLANSSDEPRLAMACTYGRPEDIDLVRRSRPDRDWTLRGMTVIKDGQAVDDIAMAPVSANDVPWIES